MIIYNESWFGLPLLSRFRGSAVIKALSPTALSTAVMLGIYYADGSDLDKWISVEHPYAIGVMMAAFTFLLTFRANFAYNRYWEACGSVHQMHSKWIDAGVNLAAFHLQSERYKDSKPRSYGENPDYDLTKRRVRKNFTGTTLEARTLEILYPQKNWFRSFFFKKGKTIKPNDPVQNVKDLNGTTSTRKKLSKMNSFSARIPEFRTNHPTESEHDIIPESRLDGGIEEEKSSLFLQEMTHLLSLLSAVSLSTLRHDIEFAETPLGTFETNQPWPPVDPDHKEAKVIRNQLVENRWLSTFMMYVFGYTRSNYHRTLYNATRPFKVIGGISDAEATLLLEARGPLAKVTLVLLWIQEFMTRESMNGSTGNVAPPIISRVHQSTTDGFDAYNQARKIAYMPFPFPHAQITTYYVVLTCFILPMFMLSYCEHIAIAGILNFFSLLCFTGLHEVARELEAPFRNAPNDIPLNNFQAQFNEALICLCAGYHPDSMWEIPEQLLSPSRSSSFNHLSQSVLESSKSSPGLPLLSEFEVEVVDSPVKETH